MPVTTEPIIRTVGLTKTYPGGIEAVKGVDLEIFPGEIYGLLGPNGAGKTTTIGMLTTRVIPTSGQAWVGGVDMIHHSALAKQVIGVVPQTNTLDRAMSVADNLVLPRPLLRHAGPGGQGGGGRAAREGAPGRPGRRAGGWRCRAAWPSG